MEYVIGKINNEVQEITQKTVKSVDELALTAKLRIDDFQQPHPAYHFQGTNQ